MFEVQNQPPPLEPYNLFASDIALREAVRREGATWAESELTGLGAKLGKPETVQLGFDANKFPPQLRSLDRYGHRLDEVDFHPAWHQLLEIALAAGLHSSPWANPKPGAHVARAAGTYMLGQIESGVCCPIAMTYGSVPTLQHAPQIAEEWLPRIYAREYDRRFRPARLKTSALVGMGMGNPDLPAPAHVIEKLKDTLGKPRTDRYSASRGIAGLRRAQAAYYDRRFGVKLNPDTQIITTLGSKEGFANVAQAITAPGDVVLVPNPSYPIHAGATRSR